MKNSGISQSQAIAPVGGGGTVTSVTASAPLASSGGNTPNISFTGTLPILNGGTGSTTKNFVDLTTSQSIGGNKTFTGVLSFVCQTYVTAVNYAVDASQNDYLIFVDTTAIPVTVTLPAPAAGRTLVFKDYKNNFSVNNFTLNPHGAEKIEYVAAPQVISVSGTSLYLVSDGTDWFIV